MNKADQQLVHPGLTCDGCEQSDMTGPRYKCVVCPDYDLCADCEAAGSHPAHNMMEIKHPGRFRILQRNQKGWM